ncbi:MAG: hypothetical protein HYZ90_01285 [Candidatus Omnitrophica bacterium]|nr:hypothetical protein [Candidatus Omnitrophota bacterium]
MRSIQTLATFPLDSVKPLSQLLDYRLRCLEETRRAVRKAPVVRDLSPVSQEPLEPVGEVEGLRYGRCPRSGSWFLMDLAHSDEWRKLLVNVGRTRHSPEAFHSGLNSSRTEHVYRPKLEWIQGALRLQHLSHPRFLELATSVSPLTRLLQESRLFSEVRTVEEMGHRSGFGLEAESLFEAAMLEESLDRVDDPNSLLGALRPHLRPGGLLFVTALVCSGFDLAVLGLGNLYLYPPDRANCFSLQGLRAFLEQGGFQLLEVSTPGVLDVEIVRSHLERDQGLPLGRFERQVVESEAPVREAFQLFLQEKALSSFARIVARKS